MIPINPGNVLPFHNRKRWQRNRQTGQDRLPFGLTAPRSRLLPFQFFVPDGNPATDNIDFFLISPVNDVTNVIMDETTLTLTEKADNSGYWVTWPGTAMLDTIPDCGFWYVYIVIEGIDYVSEVMYLTDICGVDDAALTLVTTDCGPEEGPLDISLVGVVASPDGYTYSLQSNNDGWSEISTALTYTTALTPAPGSSLELRIQVTNVCGGIITKNYLLEWDETCESITLSYVSGTVSAVGNNPTWRLEFSNTTDKGDVLYQNGYVQHLYINPIWDTPQIEREVKTEVDGYGNITRTFSRTTERKRFEFPDMPDYVLGFLAKAGDLGTVELVETELGETVVLANMEFESRRQGSLLNIGIVTFDSEIETFSGCQEDYALVV